MGGTFEGYEPMTNKQLARIQHPLWMEYQDDISAHWYALIDEGEYQESTPETMHLFDARVNELENRFRKTFFPELP